MSVKKLLDTLSVALAAHKMWGKSAPVFIQGSPGIGKSQLISQFAKLHGRKLYTFYPAYMSYDEVIGLPIIDKERNTSTYTKSSLVDVEDNSIVFLDELTNTLPHVTAVLQQFLLEKKVGGHALPKDVMIVCAGNGLNDGNATHELSSAIINRLHVTKYMGPTSEEFANYMRESNFHPLIRTIIKDRPDFINAFDTFKPEDLTGHQPFPTPRSLEELSRTLLVDPSMNKQRILDIAKGLCGEIFSNNLALYMDEYFNTPSLDEILSNPEGVKTDVQCGGDLLKTAYTLIYKMEPAFEMLDDHPFPAQNYRSLMKYINRCSSPEIYNYFLMKRVNMFADAKSVTLINRTLAKYSRHAWVREYLTKGETNRTSELIAVEGYQEDYMFPWNQFVTNDLKMTMKAR